MPSGLALRNKVAQVMKRLHATSRVVKLRVASASGGNDLLGLGQSQTVQDTVVDPQPTVNLLTADDIATSGGVYILGDYQFLFTGSIAESTLRKSHILYGDEVLRIVELEAIAMGGVVVAWRVVARSLKSGS
jgi:hypothetical protein